jgi:hypothetical protein
MAQRQRESEMGPFKALESKLSVEKVLSGYSPGRELIAAESLLKKYDGKKMVAEALELEVVIICAKAATTWHATGLLKKPSAELLRDWHILNDEDHRLSNEQMWLYTRKVAEEYAEQGKFTELAECMWPLRPVAGADHEAWRADEPCFQAAVPSDTDAADLGLRAGIWVDGIISNLTLRLASEAESSHGLQKFVEYCTTVLARIESESSSVEQEPDFVRAVVGLLRGVVAISIPSPGVHGSTTEDVDFLSPISNKKKNPDEMDGLLQKGKGLQRIVQREPFWRDRVMGYRRYSGAERERGVDLRNLRDELNAARTGGPHNYTETEALLDKAISLLPGFKHDFRPGACEDCESFVMDLINEQWATIDMGDCSQLPVVLKLEKQLKSMLESGLGPQTSKDTLYCYSIV